MTETTPEVRIFRGGKWVRLQVITDYAKDKPLDLRRVPFSLRHGLWDKDQYLSLLERRIEALKWMKANNVERLK